MDGFGNGGHDTSRGTDGGQWDEEDAIGEGDDGRACVDEAMGNRMVIVRLSELQLPELGYVHDSEARVSGTFPFSAAAGNKSTAMVYFELAPTKRLPTHTDSAEEILFILEGTVEVTVGDEQGLASAGELALVPAMIPHSVRNVGDGQVRVVGFFSSSTNMATFDHPLVPMGQPAPMEPPMAQRTIIAPPPVALEQLQTALPAANVA